MLTQYDKAIAAVLVAVFMWANQRFGLALPVDADTLSLLVGAVVTAVVYFVPNKKAP